MRAAGTSQQLTLPDVGGVGDEDPVHAITMTVLEAHLQTSYSSAVLGSAFGAVVDSWP